LIGTVYTLHHTSVRPERKTLAKTPRSQSYNLLFFYCIYFSLAIFASLREKLSCFWTDTSLDHGNMMIRSGGADFVTVRVGKAD
ncbi:MAG: hypothetical protein KZQ88_02270, partial [Candidatus Thiodiazotropha sp. (ex Dulcina madagascariensis)]|nr:hypothetical protein [Candidatus Thiodiazotropha sp. (ex Dulcina madagascariensis)]